ncbi:MAG: glycosyltransferase [Acidobacteria bacterium]|nr:glycosyltransferase [Acidobacteriota bacterium]MCA1640869.1 glycosyltransferase [Acidobacteriota bacterium]
MTDSEHVEDGAAGAAARRAPVGACEGSVSVVVPSFNHARFVERTLRSVFAQTHAPAELLVIDDGSHDDSARVIARALASCPFPCELIARENRGLAATLNEGLARAARGKYFAYLGSDDLWLPDFLRARVGLLGRRPAAALAYGHCHWIDAEDRVNERTEDWAAYADGDARAMLWRGVAPHSPTVVYRRDALARYGWNEGARLEDYELYLLLAADSEFAFDPRTLSAWRVHGGNTSRDLSFMMGEWLAAQRRVAARLGMPEEELARAQASVGWSCAENFARRGERARAAELMYHNWRGAPSLASAAKMLLRLAAPRALVERRGRRRRHDAARAHVSSEKF